MKKSKWNKLLGAILAIAFIIPVTSLAAAELMKASYEKDPVDTGKVVVSQEVQDKIRGQEPPAFTVNVERYKRFIVLLNVDVLYKNKIEELLLMDKQLKDILIAYEFLYERYGSWDALIKMLEGREAEKTWEELFTVYKQSHPDFAPRSFDFDYLNALMKREDLSEDDIMIGDQIASASGEDFETIIELRAEGESWQEISTGYGLLNTRESIPRVSITAEQLQKYISGEKLEEERIIEVLVLADKLGLNEKDAIGLAESGYSNEQIFAAALQEKYK